MKKIFLGAAMMLCMVLNAQNNDTWTEYSFGDICSLSIPNTMELRDLSSTTGKFLDKGVRRCSIKFGVEASSKKIVFQPEGLNSDLPALVHEATEIYARVIVEMISSNGITAFDIDNASASDISELNTIFYESYSADVKKMSKTPEQFQWFPLKRQKFSGKNALVLHFKRPGVNGLVDVKEYRFFLRGQQLRIVISYRETAKDTYAVDFANIMSTIKFK